MEQRGRTTAPLRARMLQAAFEALYRNRALYWLASTIPFAGKWRVWQRRVLPRLAGHDVLEVGCGIGTLLADMVAEGYRCRGIDASQQMVAATRRELRRRGLAGRDVQVTQARVQHIPFGDATFDTVVSTFPTPYIYDPAAMREIARVLRPNGRLIVVEAATLLPANPLLLPLIWLQALVYGQSVPRATDWHVAPGAGVQTDEIPGRRSAIPLEVAGFQRREQRDRTRLWQVYITIGEKRL